MAFAKLIYCIQCGKKHPSSSNYCTNDGTLLSHSTISQKDQKLKTHFTCSNCGTGAHTDASYCHRCGHSLIERHVKLLKPKTPSWKFKKIDKPTTARTVKNGLLAAVFATVLVWFVSGMLSISFTGELPDESDPSMGMGFDILNQYSSSIMSTERTRSGKRIEPHQALQDEKFKLPSSEFFSKMHQVSPVVVSVTEPKTEDHASWEYRVKHNNGLLFFVLIPFLITGLSLFVWTRRHQIHHLTQLFLYPVIFAVGYMLLTAFTFSLVNEDIVNHHETEHDNTTVEVLYNLSDLAVNSFLLSLIAGLVWMLLFHHHRLPEIFKAIRQGIISFAYVSGVFLLISTVVYVVSNWKSDYFSSLTNAISLNPISWITQMAQGLFNLSIFNRLNIQVRGLDDDQVETQNSHFSIFSQEDNIYSGIEEANYFSSLETIDSWLWFMVIALVITLMIIGTKFTVNQLKTTFLASLTFALLTMLINIVGRSKTLSGEEEAFSFENTMSYSILVGGVLAFVFVFLFTNVGAYVKRQLSKGES